MKPWYMSKKVWIAVLTAITQIAAEVFDKPELGQQLLIVGSALIGAFAAEDFGKATKVAAPGVQKHAFVSADPDKTPVD